MRIGPLKKYRKRRGKGQDRFEPRKTLVKGEIYWQVHLPRTWDSDRGVWVRKRRTARDYEEAKTVAAQARIQYENDGRRSFAIPDDVRREALAAARLLEPLGASILDAARHYAKVLQQERASEKVSNAVGQFLTDRQKDGLSRRYLTELKIRLNRFSQSFGDRMLAGISSGEIDAWLRNFKPANRNTFRAQLSVWFNYALGHSWCQTNPIAKVRKVKASSQIGIITPEQFAKVLESANDETLPYWLLGGFAGLRRAEIERLEWKDIRFDSGLVEVPALKAKTASRRFVKIQPNLATWLVPYKNRTGLVCPPDLRYQLELDRLTTGLWKPTANGIRYLKRKGIKIDSDRFKHLKPWPTNGLRHSFASYHLAHFQDAAKLALELGHTNQELLFRHYRELVTPELAAKWWEIRPATETKLVAISA